MKAETTELCRLLQAITVTGIIYNPARAHRVQEVRPVEFAETIVMSNDAAIDILREGIPIMEEVVQDAIEFLAEYDEAVLAEEEAE